MKKTRYLMITALLIAAGTGFGGRLQQKHVPENALWLMHVDFDELRNSEIGKLARQEIQSKYQEKIDALAQLLGSDITNDLFAVTLYGAAGGEENAAALVYGDYHRDTLQALLALNKAYSKTEYNGQTIHYWTDESRQKKQYGAFAADNIIAISQSEAIVRTALDVLAGKQPSLAQKQESTLSSLCADRKDTIVLVAAKGLADLAEGNEQAAILKNSKLMAALAAESGGNLKLDVHLEAQDEQSATQIELMARGMLAFVGMQAQQQPETAKLFQAIQLTRDNSVLNCTFTYPSAALFEMLQSKGHITFDLPKPEK